MHIKSLRRLFLDPNNVKLTARQKIVPILKAIDKEIPWQFIVLISFSIMAAIITGINLPVVVQGHYGNIILTVFISLVVGVVVFFVTGLTIFTIAERIIPLINKIKAHYEDEALKVKKEVLNNAEEDMLK